MLTQQVTDLLLKQPPLVSTGRVLPHAFETFGPAGLLVNDATRVVYITSNNYLLSTVEVGSGNATRAPQFAPPQASLAAIYTAYNTQQALDNTAAPHPRRAVTSVVNIGYHDLTASSHTRPYSFGALYAYLFLRRADQWAVLLHNALCLNNYVPSSYIDSMGKSRI